MGNMEDRVNMVEGNKSYTVQYYKTKEDVDNGTVRVANVYENYSDAVEEYHTLENRVYLVEVILDHTGMVVLSTEGLSSLGNIVAKRSRNIDGDRNYSVSYDSLHQIIYVYRGKDENNRNIVFTLPIAALDGHALQDFLLGNSYQLEDIEEWVYDYCSDILTDTGLI